MRGVLGGLAALASATIVFTVATRDPEDPRSVALVVVAIAVLVAALAVRVLAGPAPRRSRSRAIAPAALRRGVLAGLVTGGLAFLRAIDGLTPITAAFLVLAFLAAEYVLSARGVRSRR